MVHNLENDVIRFLTYNILLEGRFIIRWKVAGALHNPKAWPPIPLVHQDFGISSCEPLSPVLDLAKTQMRVKFASFNSSSVSSARGNRLGYFRITSFGPQ
jgi:hypothetical protein